MHSMFSQMLPGKSETGIKTNYYCAQPKIFRFEICKFTFCKFLPKQFKMKKYKNK